MSWLLLRPLERVRVDDAFLLTSEVFLLGSEEGVVSLLFSENANVDLGEAGEVGLFGLGESGGLGDLKQRKGCNGGEGGEEKRA